MEEDWDLHAVVRSCAVANSTARCSSGGAASSSSSSTTATTDIHPLSNFQPRQDDNSFSFRDPLIFTSNTRVEELHELCKPFITESPPQRQPVTPPLPFHGVQNISPQQTLKQEQQQQLNTRLIQHKRPLSSNGSKPGVTLSTQNPRTKRRKNLLKKVCHVASDGLSSDTWSWRKYGQKPIKGSPYPRGYYKCSTSKGCMARKQVERDRSNPNMFIITYTCEHNHPMPTHRNSLAGISRQKTANSETSTVGNSNIKPTNSSPENQESIREEKEEIFEDDDGEFGISNMTLDTLDPDDDFFEGLEELPVAGRGEAVVTGSTNLGQTLYMC